MTGSCVLRETILKGRPRLVPRVSPSMYLSLILPPAQLPVGLQKALTLVGLLPTLIYPSVRQQNGVGGRQPRVTTRPENRPPAHEADDHANAQRVRGQPERLRGVLHAVPHLLGAHLRQVPD